MWWLTRQLFPHFLASFCCACTSDLDKFVFEFQVYSVPETLIWVQVDYDSFYCTIHPPTLRIRQTQIARYLAVQIHMENLSWNEFVLRTLTRSCSLWCIFGGSFSVETGTTTCSGEIQGCIGSRILSWSCHRKHVPLGEFFGTTIFSGHCLRKLWGLWGWMCAWWRGQGSEPNSRIWFPSKQSLLRCKTTKCSELLQSNSDSRSLWVWQ